MRTSRIHYSANTAFRSANRVFFPTDDFYKVLQDGKRQQSNQQHSGNKQKKDYKTLPNQKKVLKNSKKKVIVKGIQFDGDSIGIISNRLLNQSITILAARNRMSRIHTYRTSI